MYGPPPTKCEHGTVLVGSEPFQCPKCWEKELMRQAEERQYHLDKQAEQEDQQAEQEEHYRHLTELGFTVSSPMSYAARDALTEAGIDFRRCPNEKMPGIRRVAELVRLNDRERASQKLIIVTQHMHVYTCGQLSDLLYMLDISIRFALRPATASIARELYRATKDYIFKAILLCSEDKGQEATDLLRGKLTVSTFGDIEAAMRKHRPLWPILSVISPEIERLRREKVEQDRPRLEAEQRRREQEIRWRVEREAMASRDRQALALLQHEENQQYPTRLREYERQTKRRIPLGLMALVGGAAFGRWLLCWVVDAGNSGNGAAVRISLVAYPLLMCLMGFCIGRMGASTDGKKSSGAIAEGCVLPSVLFIGMLFLSICCCGGVFDYSDHSIASIIGIVHGGLTVMWVALITWDDSPPERKQFDQNSETHTG